MTAYVIRCFADALWRGAEDDDDVVVRRELKSIVTSLHAIAARLEKREAA